MLRRALALSFVLFLVLTTGSAALAGRRTPLPIQVVTAADFELGGIEPLELLDAVGDIYHPAGTPGFVDPSIDIQRVDVMAWAVRGDGSLESVIDNPYLSESLALADILSGGADADLASNAPLVIVTTQVDGDIRVGDNLFCEFPLAWRNPMYTAFQGIDGDLFNGMTHVTVARVGGAVEGGFQVESKEYVDGQWLTTDTIGWAALGGNEVTYAIPAWAYGEAGDVLGSRTVQFARGGGEGFAPVDINFGAFCSEGGLTFDPGLGGVDILSDSVDLGAIPIDVLGTPAASTDTTEAPPVTATPTTLDDTPVTSVVEDEGPPADSDGGGMSPVVIGLIVGGIGGAILAGRRLLDRSDDTKRPTGLSVRLEVDGITGSFSDMSGLGFDPGSIEYRDGLESTHVAKQPGIPKHATIVLKTGTVGMTPEMFDAFAQGRDLGGGSISLLSDGGPAAKWSFDRAWPGKWTGPGFNAANNEVALETLEMGLENPRLELGP